MVAHGRFQMGRELTPEEAEAMGLDPKGPQEPVDTDALAKAASESEKAMPAGYVRSVAPGSPEAQQADLNTKMRGDEMRSASRVDMLEKILAAAQTGSLGLGDELAGAKAALSGGDYRQAQKRAESTAMDAQRKHPLASLAGVVPQVMVPGAGTVAGRLATAGYVGGLAAAGDAPGEESALETAKDSGKGALKSMAIQGGLEVASPLLGMLARMFRHGSDSQSARAMGMRGGISNKARKTGLKSEDDISDLGEFAMDNGLVPILGSKKVAQDNARNFVDLSTGTQKSILTEADLSRDPFSPALAAAKARGNLTNLNPAQVDSLGPAARAVENIDELANGLNPGSYSAANSLKSTLQGKTNYGDMPNPKEANELQKRAVRGLRESIEEQVTNALGPGRGAELAAINQKIGKGLKLEEFAKEAATREGQNRVFGLPETILAGSGLAGGIASGHPLEGAGVAGLMALLSNLAKTRGSGPGAYALRGGSAAADAASKVNQLPAAVGATDDEDRKRVARYLGLLKD